jgi:hypothetical protein
LIERSEDELAATGRALRRKRLGGTLDFPLRGRFVSAPSTDGARRERLIA